MKSHASTRPSERRLERACSYVTDLWFPANPQLVSRIKSTLREENTSVDLEHVLQELQGDYSLFLYCLKEMCQMLAQEGVTLPRVKSPLEVLREGGLARLKKILDSREDSLSRHFFDGMSPFQMKRIEEAIVSASTAQVLAREQKLNSELGFFAGLLRQLGHTLIAWNYPGVYQKALNGLKTDENLDVILNQELGFSPSMLAISLADRWHLPRELALFFEEELIDDEDFEIEEEVLATTRSISELCRIGEALARANNPESYPSARADWEFARREIGTRLGPQGLTVIREAIWDNCQQYTLSVPHFFRGGLIIDPEQYIQDYQKEVITQRNPHLPRADIRLQSHLLDFYHELDQGRAVYSLLRKLAQEIVPTAGFTGGYVFTVDPTNATLVPQLRLGQVYVRPFVAVSCDLDERRDLVSLAFQSDAPITRIVMSETQGEIASIASCIGYSQKMGVMYLELPVGKFKDNETQHLVHLRALSTALTHCLGLL